MTEAWRSSRFGYRKLIWPVAFMILMVPSYFINNGTSHDWGGDFALYVRQAINMVENIPQTDNGYIYNSECPGLGPKTYPVGLPMLVAPVYAVLGNDMAAFIDLMAVLALLFGLTVFFFLRAGTGSFMALVIALGVSYHPSLLAFKREVMSDIPFALLCLMTIMLIDRKQWWVAVPVLILASVTRTVGATLFISLALLSLWRFIQSDRHISNFLRKNRPMMVLALGLVGYLLLNHVVFATDTGYRSIFGRFPLAEVVAGNLLFYSDFLRSFLFNVHGNSLVGAIGLLLIMGLATVGWIRRSGKHLGLAEVWLPVYLFVLLIYPYRGAGFRFMLPLIPLLFYYMVSAFHGKWRIVPIVIAVAPFVFNARASYDFARSWPTHVFGPQSEASISVFEFIRTGTPHNASILFIKPRVLALYTGRHCMSNERYQDPGSIRAQVDSVGIGYLLQMNGIANPGLDSFVETYSERITPVFENSEFVLYRYEQRSAIGPTHHGKVDLPFFQRYLHHLDNDRIAQPIGVAGG